VNLSFHYKSMREMERISANLKNQGKTDDQIKIVISAYLKNMKKKVAD
jgi:hypothetical protein